MQAFSNKTSSQFFGRGCSRKKLEIGTVLAGVIYISKLKKGKFLGHFMEPFSVGLSRRDDVLFVGRRPIFTTQGDNENVRKKRCL